MTDFVLRPVITWKPLKRINPPQFGYCCICYRYLGLRTTGVVFHHGHSRDDIEKRYCLGSGLPPRNPFAIPASSRHPKKLLFQEFYPWSK